MSVSIFFCYAHEDEALLNKLKAHLRPLQRQGLIAVWHDRDISAGTDWEQEIEKHLNEAKIILLLVSPDFMNSDYCYGIEMQRALERHQRGEAQVIPIILRPVYWRGILGKLQALPKDGLPVTDPDWHSIDRAFYNVTGGIRHVVEQLHPQPKSAQPPPFLKPEAISLLRTLKGHTVVKCVAFSPDGQTFASVRTDGMIKLLDRASGQEVRTLSTRQFFIESVAFSPDGQALASIGLGDHTIKVWNLASGQVQRTLTGHRDLIRRVAFSPDGQILVSSGMDKKIKLWNLASGQEVRTLSVHTRWIHSLAFSPDGQTLASGGDDKKITLWNLASGQALHTLTGHTSAVYSVAFSPDGQTLASGSYDQTIKLWNVRTGQALHTLRGHTEVVFSVVFSPDGQTLASGSGSYDETIKLWNVASGQEVRTLTGHMSSVLNVAFSPDGQVFISSSGDGTIKIWGEK